jgi:hypothetical protein
MKYFGTNLKVRYLIYITNRKFLITYYDNKSVKNALKLLKVI